VVDRHATCTRRRARRQRVHTDGDVALLTFGIFSNRDGLLVMEDRCRIGEVNSVLPEIRSVSEDPIRRRRSSVLSSICTVVHTVNVVGSMPAHLSATTLPALEWRWHGLPRTDRSQSSDRWRRAGLHGNARHPEDGSLESCRRCGERGDPRRLSHLV